MSTLFSSFAYRLSQGRFYERVAASGSADYFVKAVGENTDGDSDKKGHQPVILSPAKMKLKVRKCPTDDLAITNCAVVNANTFNATGTKLVYLLLFIIA
ncbi:unnamed protein product [Anisakis simplex]|uniref:Major sperm protein n=1 Tax=Anisakis simplex TaxID=6269 RepID=A0A0M3J9F9_ANISI|nr:unnamed protein product [Anisakis simplex]